MNSEMTIGKRFAVTIGICLALMVVLAIVAISGLRSSEQTVVLLTGNTLSSAHAAGDIENDVSLLRGDYWRHMATNSPAEMDVIEALIREHRARLAEDYKTYKLTIDDNEEDRGNYTSLNTEIEEFDAAWQKVYPISRAGKTDEAVTEFLKVGSPKVTEIQATAAKMTAYNKRVAASISTEASAASARSLWLAWLVTGLAILAGIAVSYFMIQSTNSILREATQTLSEGSEQVVSAAGQVSSSSQSLAQGSSEQAAMIEETSAAANEINSMAQRNTENSRTTASMVTKTQKSFTQTNHMLDELLVAMDGIDESSKKISKIIKVIDEIAFQTNILALNAAVEAARAGEAGMGFAVVADEVRNLAQRSAQAAKDTAVLIEESIQKSDGGKVNVDRVAEAVRTLTSESAEMKVLVDEINLGSVEQAKGIDQISRSIVQMEQVTQSTAANSEESAAAAEELTAQAQALQEIVIRLNRLVDGSKSGYGSSSGSVALNRMGSRLRAA